MVLIRPKRILITSNYPLADIYDGASLVDAKALRRRFKIMRYKPDGDVVEEVEEPEASAGVAGPAGGFGFSRVLKQEPKPQIDV